MKKINLLSAGYGFLLFVMTALSPLSSWAKYYGTYSCSALCGYHLSNGRTVLLDSPMVTFTDDDFPRFELIHQQCKDRVKSEMGPDYKSILLRQIVIGNRLDLAIATSIDSCVNLDAPRSCTNE